MDPLPQLSVLLPVVTVLGPVGAVGPLNGSATEKPRKQTSERKMRTYFPQRCSQGAVINHRLAIRALRWRPDRDWAIVEGICSLRRGSNAVRRGAIESSLVTHRFRVYGEEVHTSDTFNGIGQPTSKRVSGTH
jgi:hypothetical protein